MSIENLKELFQDELKDVYNAESQNIKTLPRMAQAAHSDELRDALQSHVEETGQQKQRLEKIFGELGMPARGKTCDGMKGILEEGDHSVEEAGDAVIDATIIAMAQKVEHYEIATYGTLRTWAQQLGLDSIATLLGRSPEEEKKADQQLTQLAESFANAEADSGRA